ncbi:MAG: hypothetical protein H8D97_01700 [Proteobacteria bacterium]|nr:hypothetical protein [Pseudomonadota bacterium]
MEKLTTILPNQWENLLDVLKPINNHGSINIRSSSICQDINNGVAVLLADVKTLIGENIDLDIMNPNKHLKLFKLLENKDNDVDIYNDPNNSQYIATNGKIRVYLPKQIESIIPDKPGHDGLAPYGESIKLDKDDKKEIDIIIKAESMDSTDLLIRNNQLMGFEVSGTGVYLFPGYTNESDLTSETADLVLKSFAFMIIPGEEFELFLGKYDGDKYTLITGINTGLTTISLYEDVDEGSSNYGLDLI